jgi:hypothetical protein
MSIRMQAINIDAANPEGDVRNAPTIEPFVRALS